MLSYCAGCGENYEFSDHAKHRMCATNRVSSATNKESDATNETVSGHAGIGRGRRDTLASRNAPDGLPANEPRAVARSANRRSREAYNAYQREYMKGKRAAASAEKSKKIIAEGSKMFAGALQRLADK